MTLRRSLLVALPVLALACRTREATVASTAGPSVRALISAGTHQAERLELWAPPRLAELTQKLTLGAQANPQWFQDYMAQATPGQPLPYDRRLGISEAEYREYLALGDSLQLRPADTVALAIESVPEGWRFGELTEVVGLRGVSIDTLKNEVTSPQFGAMRGVAAVTPNATQGATGQWSGPRWTIEEVDQNVMTGTLAEFSVGRLEASGQTLIYYDAKRAIQGTMVAQDKLVLRLIR